MQVVFFAAAWPLRLLFCEVGFELLMRLADVGLVFHQGGKGLLDQVMFVLARVHAEWAILIFVALFSVVESTFPVNWSTVGEYFGRKHFAKIRGSMSFVSTWGSVIGPVLAGAIYDRTRSYEIMIWSCAVLLLVTSVLYALVKKPLPPVTVS